jgi:hypothetical protein
VDLTGRWQVRAASYANSNGTLRIRRGSTGLKATYARDRAPKKELPVQAFYAWGSSVRFEVAPEGQSPLVFSGSLGPDGGGGSVSHEMSEERSAWSAKRLAGQ